MSLSKKKLYVAIALKPTMLQWLGRLLLSPWKEEEIIETCYLLRANMSEPLSNFFLSIQ